MNEGLWNYAIKASDVEAVAHFYIENLDAKILMRDVILGCQAILVKMGHTRVIIFDKAPYEDDLGLNLPEGFLHDVYEVDDFEAYHERLKQAGVTFLTEPTLLDTEFDRRKLIFFESPTGIRTEVMQILEKKKPA